MLALRVFRPTRLRLGYQSYTVKKAHRKNWSEHFRGLDSKEDNYDADSMRPHVGQHSKKYVPEKQFLERSVLSDAGPPPTRPFVRVLADERVRIAVIGGPNSGKSTIFNGLISDPALRSIVSKESNTTRDVREAAAAVNGRSYVLLDTPAAAAGSPVVVAARTVTSADAAILVIDGSIGVTDVDVELARFAIDTFGTDAITLVVSKSDVVSSPIPDSAIRRLQVGEPIYISARADIGMSALEQAVVRTLDEVASVRVADLRVWQEEEAAADVELRDIEERDAELDFNLESVRRAATRSRNVHTSEVRDMDTLASAAPMRPEDLPACRMMVLGAPNAGKSTFVNTLLGYRRVATSAVAGSTLDTVQIACSYKDHRVVLLDTAGVKPPESIDEHTAVRGRDIALPRCHVVIYFVPADRVIGPKSTPFTPEDMQLLDRLAHQGIGLVIVMNKWDRVSQFGTQHQMAALYEAENILMRQLTSISGAPIIVASGATGQNVDLVMSRAIELYNTMHRRIKTSTLQTWMARLLSTATLPVTCPKPRFIVQTGVAPMTFTIFVSRRTLDPKVPEIFRKFLTANLRRSFGLGGVPIHLCFLSNHPDEVSPRYKPGAKYKEDGMLVKKQLRKRDEHLARIPPQIGESMIAEHRGVFDAASSSFAKPDEVKDFKDKKKFGLRFTANRERVTGKRKVRSALIGSGFQNQKKVGRAAE